MLILSRKLGERIVMTSSRGERITVSVMEIRKQHDGSHRIRLGIEAPPEVRVHREEVQAAIDRAAAQPATEDET